MYYMLCKCNLKQILMWGYPNRNQVEIISRIIKNLNNLEKLIVKPNPKSKYEISDDLLRLVHRAKQVVLLKHSSKMDNIWKTNVVVTVRYYCY